MHGNSARAHQFRHWASEPVVRDASRPAPVQHGDNAYKTGTCRCDFCTASHAAACKNLKAHRAMGTDTSVEPRTERMKIALRLLEDGASYAEAGRTAHTDEARLAEAYPGFEQNAVEFRAVMASLKHSTVLLELHREIWQGTRYNQVTMSEAR